MVVLSLACVLGASALLAVGILIGSDPLVLGSIALSVVAAVMLFFAMRRADARDEVSSRPWGESETAPLAPVGVPPAEQPISPPPAEVDRARRERSTALAGQQSASDEQATTFLGTRPPTSAPMNPPVRRGIGDDETVMLPALGRRLTRDEQPTLVVPPPRTNVGNSSREYVEPVSAGISRSGDGAGRIDVPRSPIPPVVGMRTGPLTVVPDAPVSGAGRGEVAVPPLLPATEPTTAARPTQQPAGDHRNGEDSARRRAEFAPPERARTESVPTGEPEPTHAPPAQQVLDTADDYDDPPDEPAPELLLTSEEQRLARVDLPVEVVDGRPRYHVTGCPHLSDKASQRLGVGEAIDLGFTPCSQCAAATTLLSQL